MYRWTCVISLLILLLPCLPGHAAVADDEPESLSEVAPERDDPAPRVALVLSGGGARGAAHLGVIRVLEELRVPVDMIIGTSGGAIIGGLYASGWSPEEIAEWLDEMDWNVALSDGLPRRDLPYRDKQDDERFLFNLEIGIGRDTVSLPKALIDGRNLAFLLEQATSRVAGVRDFDQLPIPFRAIATDLENADKVTLSSGRLSHGIRASMSVPGIFSPVTVNDRLLVDGGLVDNLPVETALDMGADIIIAVNAGSPLQDRDMLGNIFTLSAQVTSLVTYKNTQQSLALLEDQDVLIEPNLGDMGPQQFGRSLEAADMGEAAARDISGQLAELSVDADRFEIYLNGQRRESNDLGMVRDLQITGLERLSTRRIMALIQTREGEKLALDRLQSDLGRLQRLSEIEAVDFQIVEDAEGVELQLDVRERQEGPHRFRLGLELFDEFEGGARYNIRLGHTLPSLNRLGAEWRSELQMGHTRAVRSEFYQPLSSGGRYFLSLPVSYGSEPISFYEDGSRLAEFAVREGRVGLDLGVGVGAHGELRLGPWWGRISAEQRIGDFESADYSTENSGLRMLFNYDRLDNAEWPTEGQFFRAEIEQSRSAMGADQAYRSQHYQLVQFWNRGAHRFMLSGEWGQRNAALPFQQQFQLGGPFSLSGYRQGELRGDRIAATRAVWFRRIGQADGVGRAGEMFVGAGLASGAAWRYGEGSPSDDIAYGGQLFLAAATPLGPVMVGMTQSDAGRTGYFLALGLPIHRPRPVASPW